MAVSEGIIIAIITGVFAVFGQWIIANKTKADQEIQQAVLNERTDNRLTVIGVQLEQVERKLDEHNGYAKKITSMQKDIALMKNEIVHIRKQV